MNTKPRRLLTLLALLGLFSLTSCCGWGWYSYPGYHCAPHYYSPYHCGGGYHHR